MSFPKGLVKALYLKKKVPPSGRFFFFFAFKMGSDQLRLLLSAQSRHKINHTSCDHSTSSAFWKDRGDIWLLHLGKNDIQLTSKWHLESLEIEVQGQNYYPSTAKNLLSSLKQILSQIIQYITSMNKRELG